MTTTDTSNDRFLFRPSQWQAIIQRYGFTPRESDVVHSLVTGRNEAQVADLLGISTHTVHAHVKRIYQKAGVRDRAQLMVRLFEASMLIASG